MSKVKIADVKTDMKRGVDHIGVTVCFVVHDGEGNVLLQKRSQGCRDERGTWDVGGGAVEFGENIVDAVKREVFEELKVKPLKVEYIITFDAHRTNHDGEKTHWIALGHAVQVDRSKVMIGEPHKIDELDWFTSINLPSPLHSQMQRLLNPAINLGIVK